LFSHSDSHGDGWTNGQINKQTNRQIFTQIFRDKLSLPHGGLDYNRPAELDALKYTDFLEKYNTSLKLPKYYEECPNTLNNISINRHYFKVYMDPDQSIHYVYQPVRQVKICICIDMLYITSGDIFNLRLIPLNRKAHSDKDVLTYRLVWAKKVLLAAICLVAGSASFGIREN
jgi:hypothetical protein